MTTLTNALFVDLKKLNAIAGDVLKGPHLLWFQLAIIAVTALVDIADTFTAMIRE